MSARLVAAALLLLLAGPTSASPGACKHDLAEYCAGVVCRNGACHSCLNEHKNRLDPACVKALAKWDEKQQ